MRVLLSARKRWANVGWKNHRVYVGRISDQRNAPFWEWRNAQTGSAAAGIGCLDLREKLFQK
jgi:hypothetical protein